MKKKLSTGLITMAFNLKELFLKMIVKYFYHSIKKIRIEDETIIKKACKQIFISFFEDI